MDTPRALDLKTIFGTVCRDNIDAEFAQLIADHMIQYAAEADIANFMTIDEFMCLIISLTVNNVDQEGHYEATNTFPIEIRYYDNGEWDAWDIIEHEDTIMTLYRDRRMQG